MNLWVLLPALVLVAALYVLVPVGWAMASHYRRRKLVRCPLTGLEVAIKIERAGLAEALGRRTLRQVGDCSLWPKRARCDRPCLACPEEAIRELPLAV